MKRKVSVYAIFTIAPLILLAIHVYFFITVDHQKYGINTDPDYAYLLSAIDISRLGKSKMVLHPGTTYQLLAHLVMRCAYYLHGDSAADDFPTSVIKYPTFYLNALQGAFSALNIILVFIIGVLTYSFTQKVLAGLFFQFTPFLSPQIVIFGFRKVTTDTLLVFISLIMMILLLKRLQAGKFGRDRKEIYIFSVLFGIVVGFGLATKITFLPLAVLPFFIIPGFLPAVLYIAAAVMAVIVFTIPIIPQYPTFFKFLYLISTHRGIYGHGDKSILDIDDYSLGLFLVIKENIPFIIIFLVSIAVLVLVYSRRRLKKIPGTPARDIRSRLLLGVMAVQIIGILFVARHFKSKYLIPELCLGTLALYLVYLQREQFYRGAKLPAPAAPMVKKRFTWRGAVCIFLGVFSFLHTLQGISDFQRSRSEKLEEAMRIEKKLNGEFKDYCVVYYYNASSVIFGLEFGDQWTPLYGDLLNRVYGEKYFYNNKGHYIFSWGRGKKKRIPLEKLKTRCNNKVLFFGTPFPELYRKVAIPMPQYPLTDVFGGKYVTIYTLNAER